MLTIIYAKDCNKAEAWAAAHRDAENTIFVRDERQFVIKDIEPCDQVLLFNESAKVRKAYRSEKIKLFTEDEEKQSNDEPVKPEWLTDDSKTRVTNYYLHQLRVKDVKHHLKLRGVDFKANESRDDLIAKLVA